MKNQTILLTLLATCLMLVACDTKTKSLDSCGDGFLDPGEMCDQNQTLVANCEQMGYYTQNGEIECNADCTPDLSVCSSRCGDEIVQSMHGEDCDGANVSGRTCANLGLGGGALACDSFCRFDTSGCDSASVCGDGIIVFPLEQCEGQDLQEETCETLGYYGGILSCNAATCQFDLTSCSNFGKCGDGVIQGVYQEECEGANLDGATCESLLYYGGNLICGTDCRYDLTHCEAVGRCGDELIQSLFEEECDGANLDGQTCVSLGFRMGTLTCETNCRLNVSACVPISTNADLSALNVSSGTLTPAFNPATTAYAVGVMVSSMTVTATKADTYANIAIAPTQPMTLVQADTPVTVTVTAENGAVKVYTVVVRWYEFENCMNRLDDNGNLLVDCADPACSLDSACTSGPENCSNGTDDDGDGKVDCADPDCRDLSCGTGCVCAYGARQETACTDGVDNDGDGLMDCADPICAALPICGGGNENCTDGLDNDTDGFIDCVDGACQTHPRCTPFSSVIAGNPGTLCNTGLPSPCNAGRIAQISQTCKPLDPSCY